MALEAARPHLQSLPHDASAGDGLDDIRGAAFRGLDHTVSQSHVDSYFHVATAVAESLTASTARLGELLGECAVDGDTGNDSTCIEDFLRNVGKWALRRPLTDAEAVFLRDTVYGDESPTAGVSAEGTRDVLVTLLSAPQFLYHVEDRGEPDPNRRDHQRLSGYELASRLSYLFWQTLPDGALMEAAEDGSLLTDRGYRDQVERVFEDPRTDQTLRDFYGEWLGLDRVPHPYRQVGDARYDAFAGDDVPTPELRQHMIDEVLDLAIFYSRSQRGTLDDIFTSDLSFTRHQDLADLYGVDPWDGEGTPASFPRGERTGVLTRAALLLSEGVDTHPVLKGVLIRRNILCDNLPNPPDNVNRDSTLEAPYTRRQETEDLTEQPGSSCVVCHAVINPLGFVTENFDGLGRLRTNEPFILPDGRVVASLPLDTSGAPQVVAGDTTVIDSATQLASRIVESGKAHACFARHYYRFTRRRVEHLKEDACALEDLRVSLAEGRSLREALMSVAFHPSFKLRRSQP